MLYSEHPIHPVLSPYIQSIWSLESENDEDVYTRSQIMPDGIVEAVFHYGDPFLTHIQGRTFKQPEHFAISMMLHYIEIESTGKTGFISVRFYPWGAHHFFQRPVNEFLDSTIDGKELWSYDPEQVTTELRSMSTIEERHKRVEQFLLEQFRKNSKASTPIDTTIRLIRETKGILSIEEVCERTGIPKKQLERKFPGAVGTTPKVFSRITRFLHICQHLENYRSKPLTELAYECGYYDQAHFIREFKAFSGYTLSEFFNRSRVYSSKL